MGIQDRDYYKEHSRKQRDLEELLAKVPSRTHMPSLKLPPDMPGAGLHWTLKILVIAAIAGVLFVLAKLLQK